MKIRTIFITMFFLLFSAANADAQMCGRYRVGLIVLNEKNQPINDADVRFLPITKDETLGKRFVRDGKDFSKFWIEFQEGQSLKEFHKLIVSAKGYKTAETRFRFYSCRRLQMQVKLPKSAARAQPAWTPANEFGFYISDEDRRRLEGVKISIFKDGEFLKTLYSKIGGVGLKLDFGEYVFKFEKKGYRAEEVNFDATAIDNPRGISLDLKREK